MRYKTGQFYLLPTLLCLQSNSASDYIDTLILNAVCQT